MPVEREDLIGELRDAPTLPFIAAKLVNTIENPASTALDVARIVMSDQATSSSILRLANSAHFGLTRRVGTIKEAVVIVGFRNVQHIAIGISVLREYLEATDADAFDCRRLWLHTIAVGCAAKILAREVGAHEEEAFLCGLLHDLGKVFLASRQPEEYARAVGLSHEADITIWDAEQRTFGYNHAEVGEAAMAAWHLPDHVPAAARWHHDPGADRPHSDFIALIHAGDCVARRAHVGSPGDDLTVPVEPWVAEMLNLTEDRMEALRWEVSEAARDRWRALVPRG
jgi:putative nucleotidyltransferase with HDIG domain